MPFCYIGVGAIYVGQKMTRQVQLGIYFDIIKTNLFDRLHLDVVYYMQLEKIYTDLKSVYILIHSIQICIIFPEFGNNSKIWICYHNLT